MSETSLKIAVFIDFDNIEIGVKTTLNQSFDVGAVLDAIKERGEVITKVAFGDWKRTGDYSRMMTQHAVRMVQRNMTPGGDKNGADINLALDALEMAFTHAHINAFVIVGGDSDFISLVEKLKQYDRKVFVVGGRQFTSAVMQKNCTEFIAYENLIRQPARRQPASSGRERPGTPVASHAPLTTAPVNKVFPLVERALQLLTDREVTPQLGLLKSTLLQLDSTFSERDYGASSFRDFADKLAEAGLVTLRSAGRSVLVDLREAADHGEAESLPPEPVAVAAAERVEHALPQPDVESEAGHAADGADAQPPVSFADGVALLRRVLGMPGAVARWPMYIRNVKQILRAAEPSFDERRHGNLVELLRAVQREGLVRLDRDRQGVMRVFQGPQLRVTTPTSLLGLPVDDDIESEATAVAPEQPSVAEPPDDSVGPGNEMPPPYEPPSDDQALIVETSIGNSELEPAGAKLRRRRRTPDGAAPAKSTAARKPRSGATSTRKRKDKESA